jgi:hypothetical protein
MEKVIGNMTIEQLMYNLVEISKEEERLHQKLNVLSIKRYNIEQEAAKRYKVIGKKRKERRK